MSSQETHTTAGASAAAIITDAEGRCVIVNPHYKPGWNLPGGRLNVGETPREGCAREVREELGLELEIGDLLVHAWVNRDGGSHVYYIFDTPSLTAEQIASITLQDAELTDMRITKPEEIDRADIPKFALTAWSAALAAREDKTIRYVEVNA
ncbi:NUDIX domain-containing protein [Streptomyces sp. NPDC020800]|uniref:NUDIX domain-containing protein n=1 Tax=Streptomyces sp. NPDC020800 TaxID=3365092 RepID=UPI0037909061